MLLEVKKLTVGYHAPVVRDATFALPPGQVTALLGPNGCGKSTLLRGISGGGKVFSGGVRVCGQNCLALTARRRARFLSLLPQRVGVLPGLTAGEVIATGRYIYGGVFGGPSPEDTARVASVAETFGVADLLDKDCAALSEGQRQLVHLCRVAVQEAPVLLLDEPNSALDFANTHRLFATLRAWVAGQNKTALVVLHDPALALRWCDRLLLMQDGTLCGELCPTDGAETLQAGLRRLYPGLAVVDGGGSGRMFCTMATPHAEE